MDKIPDEELIKAGIEKAGEPLYKDAVHPGAQELGQAVGTILGLLNTLLTPIALVNLRVKAIYERVSEKLKKGAEKIPPERQVEPPLDVIVPALEAVKCVEDKKLQDMFVELLVSSIDSEKQSGAHKAFVKILEELSSYDAWLLKQIYERKYNVAIKSIHSSFAPLSMCSCIMGGDDIGFEGPPISINSMDNLLRLKLINLERITYEKWEQYIFIFKAHPDVEHYLKEEMIRLEVFKHYSQGVAEQFFAYHEPSCMMSSLFGYNFCRTCIPNLNIRSDLSTWTSTSSSTRTTSVPSTARTWPPSSCSSAAASPLAPS